MLSDNVEFLRYCGGHFENGDDRKCSMSGIKSNLPTYQMLMTSDNFEFFPPIFYAVFGSHFENSRYLENFENAELLL